MFAAAVSVAAVAAVAAEYSSSQRLAAERAAVCDLVVCVCV